MRGARGEEGGDKGFSSGGEGHRGAKIRRALERVRACVSSYTFHLSSLRSVFAGSRAGSVFVHAAILDFK